MDQYKKGEADFHQMIADMAGIERKQAKTINLGIMYGMGKNKLMAQLGLQVEQAEELLKRYHQNAPFVKMMTDAVTRRAESSGKIRTVGGRLSHFDLWEPHGYGIKKPLNHVVESPEQAKKIIEIMESAITLEVPNKVDYEVGTSWGDIA